jgi:hypothetical protein
MAGWQQRLIPVLTCRVSDRSHVDLTFIRSSTTATRTGSIYAVFVFLLGNVITSLNYDGKYSGKKRDINSLKKLIASPMGERSFNRQLYLFD